MKLFIVFSIGISLGITAQTNKTENIIAQKSAPEVWNSDTGYLHCINNVVQNQDTASSHSLLIENVKGKKNAIVKISKKWNGEIFKYFISNMVHP